MRSFFSTTHIWKNPTNIPKEDITPSEPLEALLDGDVGSSVTFRFPNKVQIFRSDINSENSRQERGGRLHVGCIMVLPSERQIRRLVVHANRLEQFDVRTRVGSESWETQAQIRDNRDTKVVVNLSTLAKYVKIVALSDYRLSDGGSRSGENIIKTYASAPATICEVELYGWAD